ncbi:MAG: toxin-antitoxin system YwqK family antitoxin, partial [Sphingobacteriales bacterium]
LLLAPEGTYSTNAIKILSNISKSTDDVLEMVKNKKPSAEKSFNTIQDILLSKIATDPKYKSLVNINDDMIKQIQVICEKLEYKKGDPGFTMQYYVPFFEKTFKEKRFEPMIYTMFSGVDIKPIKTWNQGNKKEKEAFILLAANYLNEIRFSRVLPYTDRQAATSLYVYNNDVLVAKGFYVMAKGEMQPQGTWEFFNDEGRITLRGEFSKQSKKTGEWVSFYSNGKVKEKINYKEDMYEGPAFGWFDNGNKWYDETYKSGQLHGVQTIRYLNGNRKSIIDFENGKETGEVKYFNISDQLTHTYTYKNGVLDGPYKTYHSNGKLNEESAFIKDVESGDYKSYYETGEQFATGKISNGKRQGLWINYYKDGTPKAKSTYLDGEFTGEFSEFFEDGKTNVTGNYVKKKLDGKVSYYDKDGILY